ncbi:hypothetical protein MNEG_10525, partial [Monoraphidium neglectum]
MEATPEGLAVAAATRELLGKKRKAAQDAPEEPQSSKKLSRPPPTCTHEVARPEGFDDATVDLDEKTH